jgi:hypothetical protein
MVKSLSGYQQKENERDTIISSTSLILVEKEKKENVVKKKVTGCYLNN